MGFFTGKTAIITGAGFATLSDGRCGSIGYGIATAYSKKAQTSLSQVVTLQSLKRLRKSLKSSMASRFLQSRLIFLQEQTTKLQQRW